MTTSTQPNPSETLAEPESLKPVQEVIIDPELFARIAKNKATRLLILWSGVAILSIMGILLWSIVQQALGSQDYTYVLNKQSTYNSVGFIFAAIAGVFVAAWAAHPVRADYLPEDQQPKDPKASRKAQLKSVDGLLLFGAFMVGTIPGLVLMFIIRYPLSTHACKLSGSKYC